MAGVLHAVDTSQPNNARTYDYLLGGKDNFEVDRQAVAAMLTVAPHLAELIKDLRRWSQRVVHWLAADMGVDQFLDCGSGLPTMRNTHEAAQDVNTGARVAYVDNDPAVIAHSHALLEDNTNTQFFEADLREPDGIFDEPTLYKFLELDRPVALIQCSTIDYVPQLAQRQSIMARYVDRLASGSYVVLTHTTNPRDDSALSQFGKRINATMPSGDLHVNASRVSEIRTLFDGLELLDPGLVPAHRWWPQGPQIRPVDPVYDLVVCGVARKP
jgi:hypothetical protein